MQIAFVCDNLRNDWLEVPKKAGQVGIQCFPCYSRVTATILSIADFRRYDAVFMLSTATKPCS